MSINNSYFSRNNTIVHNSYVNTGRNPVTQLYYGDGGLALEGNGGGGLYFNTFNNTPQMYVINKNFKF